MSITWRAAALLALVLVLMALARASGGKAAVEQGATPDAAVSSQWRRHLLLDTLDVGSALNLLKTSSPATGVALCRAPLGTDADVPTLHFLLYLYFRSGQDLASRRGLVQLLQQCVEQHGSDVTESFNQDPSVLFKALLLREMGLAKAIAEAAGKHVAGSALLSRSIFSHLYAVPCEVVPLSKLLLHAATIISKKGGVEHLGGLDGLKRLIAGASLGGQNKPAVRGGDLAALAPTFHETLDAPDFASRDYRLQLQGLTRALDEVASATHGALLAAGVGVGVGVATENTEKTADNGIGKYKNQAIVAALAETEPATRRNALHLLAVSGATLMITQLTDFVSAANLAPLLQQTMASALLAPDLHGMLPAAYAFVRFGAESRAFGAMVKLCEAVSPEVADACKAQHPEVLLPKSGPPMNENVAVAVAAEVEVGVDGKSGAVGEDSSGGWSSRRLEGAQLTGDADRCDIPQEFGPPPSREEFYRRFVLTNTPVIFRGAARGSGMQQAFRRDNFIKRYGGVTVEVGAIPYPSSFGVAGSASTLQRVADLDSAAPSSDTKLPDYAFTVLSPRWRAQLARDCPLPAFVPLHSGGGGGGGGGASEDHEIQFYLGPAGSGAPVHFHGHAVNSMAFGEKRWFLFPPGQGFYSTLAALEFVANTNATAEAWQCTQRSGDVVYVPTLWSHATLNVRQSVGVAHEFSIEPFCME